MVVVFLRRILLPTKGDHRQQAEQHSGYGVCRQPRSARKSSPSWAIISASVAWVNAFTGQTLSSGRLAAIVTSEVMDILGLY